MTKSGNQEEPQPIAPQPPRAIEKTPMFTAMNAARYQRQTLIRDIETTQPKLLCYVAGNKATVDRADTLGFVDMLHNVTLGACPNNRGGRFRREFDSAKSAIRSQAFLCNYRRAYR